MSGVISSREGVAGVDCFWPSGSLGEQSDGASSTHLALKDDVSIRRLSGYGAQLFAVLIPAAASASFIGDRASEVGYAINCCRQIAEHL